MDPLAEKTMTPYQYVSNNTVIMVDPTGMEVEGLIGKKQGDGSTSWKFDKDVNNGAVARELYGNDTEFYAGGDRIFNEKVTDRQVNLTTGGQIVPVSNIQSGVSFSDMSTAGQLGGGISINLIKDATNNRIDKSFYLMGSYHYSNFIDFMGQSGSNVGVNIYAKGYKESMSQMKTLSSTMGVMSKALDYAVYIDGGLKIYNGDYKSGAHSIGNNYIGPYIETSMGWGYESLYSASYSG